MNKIAAVVVPLPVLALFGTLAAWGEYAFWHQHISQWHRTGDVIRLVAVTHHSLAAALALGAFLVVVCMFVVCGCLAWSAWAWKGFR